MRLIPVRYSIDTSALIDAYSIYWTTCAIEVEDWMDVPIAETTEEGRRMGAVTPR